LLLDFHIMTTFFNSSGWMELKRQSYLPCFVPVREVGGLTSDFAGVFRPRGGHVEQDQLLGFENDGTIASAKETTGVLRFARMRKVNEGGSGNDQSSGKSKQGCGLNC
jgi:hypothetical protein